MEKIAVVCPGCDAPFKVPQTMVGRSGKCPKCGATIVVPDAAAAGDSAEAAEPADEVRQAAGIRRRLGPRPRAEDVASANLGLALAGAAGGALAGAAIWAVTTYLTHYEIGWIAWAVGGLAGLGATILGGRGQIVAAAAAALAVAGIIAGAYVAAEIIVRQSFRAEVAKHWAEERPTPDDFKDLERTAAALVALADPPGDPELRQFLVDHGYSGPTAEQVGDEEVGSFLRDHAPGLRRIAAERPTYGEWVAGIDAQIDARADQALASISTKDVLIRTLAPTQLLFLALGIVTAYGVVMRASRAELGAELAEERRTARRSSRRRR